MERASEDWNTDSELEIEYAAPLLAGDASFWRARRNDFREYNTGANSLLSVDWDSMTDSWSLRGSAAARSEFESLATIAAKGLQTYDPDEPWRSWLDELRRRKRNYRESPTKVAYSRRALEDPSKFGIEPPKVKGELRTGTVDRIAMTELFGRETGKRQESSFAQTRFTGVDGIAERLFEASINLCLEFEAATVINVGHREDRDTSTKEGPDREAPKRKPAKQNQRYKTIDGALRQIAEARPATQGEVFKMLGERHGGIPNAEPFLTARGWMAGFEGDEAAARAWLSKRWAGLNLPTFPRGPKK
jgi:hypothetical protein